MKEEEIRPKAIMDEYLSLSVIDGQKLDKNKFTKSPCQGCASNNVKLFFTKDGFEYLKCTNCNSLFCSPRPTKDQLDSLYHNSESSTFWSNVFFPSVVESRRLKLFAPKAKKIAQMIKDKNLQVSSICDVGAGHGLFLEELKKELPGVSYYAIEPDHNSSNICRSKGIITLESTAENAAEWWDKFDLIICSEVIEHVFNVKEFITCLFKLLKNGGHCLVTGLGYEGFDILTLGEKSKSVSPPHHLNFLSIDGFTKVFKSSNFSEVEIWTPGELDVDIVFNSGFENEFLAALKRRGEKTIQEFQFFLANNQLSSHCWILGTK